MQEKRIVLSKIDYIILESYKNICDGLSEYLGDGYEIVLHCLENYEHSVIKIINGHHTGRTIGSPITDFALSMLSQTDVEKRRNHIAYFSKNEKGEQLKSTTISIFGENKRVIGLLCMNFYMNTTLAQLLTSLNPLQQTLKDNEESYMDNIDDMILKMINQEKNDVLNDINIPSNMKNKEIISRLFRNGVFNLKDSIIKCAHILGISKNTVYMHIRSLKKLTE